MEAKKTEMYNRIHIIMQSDSSEVIKEQLIKDIDELPKEDASDIVETYSKQASLELAMQMRDRLPREIRTFVYQHYWDFGRSAEYKLGKDFYHRSGIEEHYKSRSSFEDCQDPGKCGCFTSEQLPTCVLPAYVGYETAQEAALELVTCIMLDNANPTHLLNYVNDYLNANVFHLGITAATTIRKLSVFTYDPLRQKVKPYGKRHEALLSRQRIREAKSHLQSLLNIRLKRGLDINLSIDSNISAIDLERVIELFRDVYFSLTRDGAKVSIAFWSMHFAIALSRPLASIDISDYYFMPLQKWREKHGINRWIESKMRGYAEDGLDYSTESVLVDS